MASIRRHRSGTWQVRYYDPMGRERARNFARKTDAKQFAAAVETDKSRGDWLDPRLAKVTFGEWADDWLASIAHLKPKTRLDYETSLRKHVLPVLANAQVGSLDRADLRRFVSELTAQGARPDTVRIAAQVTRSVFELAVDAGAIKANPARGLKIARTRRAEKHFLTPDQVHDLAEAIDGQYSTLIRFAAYTGLRAGEIGGLRVGRLDLLRSSVEVAETLQEVSGQLVFGETKTYERRHIPLPPFLRGELAAYLTGRSADPDELVFTAARGGPLRHNLFYTKKFKPAVLTAGLPSALRFHDLRHTFAAFCIASTADPYAVMKRMGHSSITVTYDTYGHLFPERNQEVTDGLEALYRRSTADPERTRKAVRGTVCPLK